MGTKTFAVAVLEANSVKQAVIKETIKLVQTAGVLAKAERKPEASQSERPGTVLIQYFIVNMEKYENL